MNGQMESTTEEQSNVLQQVQAEEDIHRHLHEISKRNTDRGVETKTPCKEFEQIAEK